MEEDFYIDFHSSFDIFFHIFAVSWTKIFTDCFFSILDLRSVSPTDETVAINNNNDPEKRRQSSDLKNITASKRLSDSVLKTSLVTTLSPTTTNLCTDEIDDLLEIVGGGLNKAPSKDSGFDQSSSNVLFNSSTSSNSEHLHDIALDESGIAADNSTIETPIKEKLVQSYQQSPLLPMSPETDSNDISMNETPPVERTFENGEIMNPKSPFSLNFEGRDNLSMVQMVCRELLETERSYVNDLKEVIEVGFLFDCFYHANSSTYSY